MEKNTESIGAFNIEGFDFNLISEIAHKTAKDKGFWENERNDGELFMLMISELGEAMEAHRKGKFASNEAHSFHLWMDAITTNGNMAAKFKNEIKDTFEDELADTLIRIADYAGAKNLHIKLLVGTEAYNDVADAHFPENVGEMLVLVSSRITSMYACSASQDDESLLQFLSDAVNESFLIARALDIDIVNHIRAKMEYNKTREKLHGKSY